VFRSTAGGVCWMPSALRTRNRTMEILAKEVAATTRKGRTAKIAETRTIEN